MDADLYDEFGNYIGPELPSDDESEEEQTDSEKDEDEEEVKNNSILVFFYVSVFYFFDQFSKLENFVTLFCWGNSIF